MQQDIKENKLYIWWVIQDETLKRRHSIFVDIMISKITIKKWNISWTKLTSQPNFYIKIIHNKNFSWPCVKPAFEGKSMAVTSKYFLRFCLESKFFNRNYNSQLFTLTVFT